MSPPPTSAVEIAELMLAGANEGLAAAATELLTEAVAQAPEGTEEEGDRHPGELRDSARIDVEAGGSVVVVSFNTAYAAKQHEALHYHHQKGKARYLEDPLQAMIPRLPEIVAGPVRNLFAGRGEISHRPRRA